MRGPLGQNQIDSRQIQVKSLQCSRLHNFCQKLHTIKNINLISRIVDGQYPIILTVSLQLWHQDRIICKDEHQRCSRSFEIIIEKIVRDRVK